jgi:HSP20 family molecular chaperone IbpA
MSDVKIQRLSETDNRSDPIFEEFDRLADRIRTEAYNLFAHRGSDEGHALDDWLAAERRVCWPAAELEELDGEYNVKVALAGFDPDEVTVTATPREILVRARHQQRQSKADGKARLRWSEFRANDVLRRIEVPSNVDVSSISANLHNGLLEIAAPKAGARRSAATAKSAKGKLKAKAQTKSKTARPIVSSTSS